MTQRITPADLDLAAEWLDAIDPHSVEAPAILRVAAFLRREADRRELDAVVRSVAREKGVKPAAVRSLMAQHP